MKKPNKARYKYTRRIILVLLVTSLSFIAILTSGIISPNILLQIGGGDGFLTDEGESPSTLQVIDFELGRQSVAVDEEIESEVILANYGTEPVSDVQIEPEVYRYDEVNDEISSVVGKDKYEITERPQNVTLFEGEHIKQTFYISFGEDLLSSKNKKYAVRLSDGGNASDINLKPAQQVVDLVAKGSSTTGSSFVDRKPVDLSRYSADLYKDSRSSDLKSPFSDLFIPPVETENNSDIIQEPDVAKGMISNFVSIREMNTRRHGSISANSGNLYTGMKISDVNENKHYVLRVVYKQGSITQDTDIEFRLVDSVGKEIDQDTHYRLHNTKGLTDKIDFHLSSEEVEHIRSQNTLDLEIEMTNGTKNYQIDTYMVSLIGSNEVSILPDSDLTVNGLNSSRNSYQPGDNIVIDAVVENKGGASFNSQIPLVEQNQRSSLTPVDLSDSVVINPGEKLNLSYSVKARPKGTHEYVIGDESLCSDSQNRTPGMSCPLVIDVLGGSYELIPNLDSTDESVVGKPVDFDVQGIVKDDLKNVKSLNWSETPNNITNPSVDDLNRTYTFTTKGTKSVDFSVKYEDASGNIQKATDTETVEISGKPTPTIESYYYDVITSDRDVRTGEKIGSSIGGEISSCSSQQCKPSIEIGGFDPATSTGLSMLVINEDVENRSSDIEFYGTYDISKDGYATSKTGKLSLTEMNKQIATTQDANRELYSDIQKYSVEGNYFIFVTGENPNVSSKVENKLKTMGAELESKSAGSLSSESVWSFVSKKTSSSYQPHHESYLPAEAQTSIQNDIEIAPIENSSVVPSGTEIYYAVKNKGGGYGLYRNQIPENNISWSINGVSKKGYLVEDKFSNSTSDVNVNLSVDSTKTSKASPGSIKQKVKTFKPKVNVDWYISDSKNSIYVTGYESYNPDNKIQYGDYIFTINGKTIAPGKQYQKYNIPNSGTEKVDMTLNIKGNTDSATAYINLNPQLNISVERLATEFGNDNNKLEYETNRLPTAHYPLDDAHKGGVVSDIIGFSDGTAGKNKKKATGIKPGSTAASFSSTNGVILVQDIPDLDFASHTQMAWVKTPTVKPQQAITGKRQAYSFKIRNGGLRFTTPGILDHDRPNIPELQPGKWVHIAVAFEEGEKVRFYVNGEEYTVGTASKINSNNDQPLKIGSNQWGEDFQGSIDELRLYSGTLNQNEIESIYEARNIYDASNSPGQAFYSFGSKRADVQRPNLSRISNPDSVKSVFGEGSVKFKGEQIKIETDSTQGKNSSRYVQVKNANLSRYDNLYVTYKREFERKNSANPGQPIKPPGPPSLSPTNPPSSKYTGTNGKKALETGFVSVHHKQIGKNNRTFGSPGVDRGSSVPDMTADSSVSVPQSKNLETMRLDVSGVQSGEPVTIGLHTNGLVNATGELSIYDIWASDSDPVKPQQLFSSNLQAFSSDNVSYAAGRDGVIVSTLDNNSQFGISSSPFKTGQMDLIYDLNDDTNPDVNLNADGQTIFCRQNSIGTCLSKGEPSGREQLNGYYESLNITSSMVGDSVLSIDTIQSRVDKSNKEYQSVLVDSANSTASAIKSYQWSSTGKIKNPNEAETKIDFNSKGSHKIKLVAKDVLGQKISKSKTIQVSELKPNIKLDAVNDQSLVGEKVTFNVGGVNPSRIDKTRLIYRDGSSDATKGTLFTHSFPEPGEYEVIAVVKTDKGLTATATETVEIQYQKPVINFPNESDKQITTHVKNDLALTGTGNYPILNDPKITKKYNLSKYIDDSVDVKDLSFTWKMPSSKGLPGGSRIVNGEEVLYETNELTGKGKSLDIIVEVQNPQGISETVNLELTTYNNGTNIDDFKVVPNSVLINETVTAGYKGVEHPHPRIGGTINLSMGDGTVYSDTYPDTQSTSLKQSNYSFKLPPSQYDSSDFPVSMNVKLEVTDETGYTQRRDKTVIVKPIKPKVVIESNITSVRPINDSRAYTGQDILFDGSKSYSNASSIANYRWSTQNRPIEFGSSADFSFTKSGSTSVNLEVTDQYGFTNTDKTDFYIINRDPVAKFNILDSKPYLVGEKIEFDARKSYDPEGDNLVYNWAFNNCQLTTQPSPTLTGCNSGSDSGVSPDRRFSYTGNHSIKLSVFDSLGNKDTEDKTIEIKPGINADIKTKNTGSAEFEFNASQSSTGGVSNSIVEYKFDFDGDGTYERDSTQPTLTHKYNNSGVYTPKVKVIDSKGYKDTATGSQLDVEVSSSTVIGQSGHKSNLNSQTWGNVNLDSSIYDSSPYVFALTTTINGGQHPSLSKVRSVSQNGFETQHCEYDSYGCDNHNPETNTWIALDPGKTDAVTGMETGSLSLGANTQTVSFSDSFSQAPYVFAQIQTNNGADAVQVEVTDVRSDGFDINICEQDSTDGCAGSVTSEEVAWWAVSPSAASKSEIFDWGSFTTDNSDFETVSFSQSYSADPAVITMKQSDNGGQNLAAMEGDTLTSSSVRLRFCESEYDDTCDTHAYEKMAWLSVPTGEIKIDSGNSVSDKYGFESGDVSDWDSTNSLKATQGKQYEGSFSGLQKSSGDPVAVLKPSELENGGQPKSISWAYREKSADSVGGAVSIHNSEGDIEAGGGSSNPDWEYYTANGWSRLSSGDGYFRWVEFTIDFDWGQDTFSYTVEDKKTGKKRSASGLPLKYGKDVEEIRLRPFSSPSSGWDGGLNHHNWWDSFEIQK